MLADEEYQINVNLMKVSVMGKVVILLNLLSSSLPADEGESISIEHAKIIQKYKIENNFRGFGYSSELSGERSILNITNFFNDEKEKKLTGFWLSSDTLGNIKEIGPVFEPTSKKMDVFSWALSNYYSDKINFDTLWVVLRATSPEKTNDKSLVFFLLDTLNQSLDGSRLMEKEFIKQSDEFYLTIQKIYPNRITNKISLSELLVKLEHPQ